MPVKPDHTMTMRILEGARRLSQSSREIWSMSDLAQEAGVSRSSLYRRFSSREAVLEALAQQSPGDEIFDVPTVRERALDALGRLVRQKGLGATTLEEVAGEANLGVATIYRHFGGREGLLEAYGDAHTPKAMLSSLLPGGDKPLAETLEALAEQMILHLREEGPHLLMGLSPDPEARQVLGHLLELEARARAQFREYLTAEISAGRIRGDGAVLTNGFVGLVAGIVLLGRDDEADPKTLAHQVVSIFLQGCEVQECS